jgi:hypothetical protein
MNMKWYVWIRWITRLAVLASFVLIGWFLCQHTTELRSVHWRNLLWPIMLGLLLYCLALSLQGSVWITLWSFLTGVPWGWKDVRAYFVTHLMRRIPGAPWYIAGRALLYYGRSPEAARAAFIVSLIEWGGLILTGLVWMVGRYWGLPGIMFYGALLTTVVPIMRRWAWLRRWVPLQRLPLCSLYLALLSYTAQWTLAALMLHEFLHTITPIHTPNLLQTGVIWALSGIISSLAVFAPAGLGIRELSLVTLLEPYIGFGHAALIALLMRLIFTMGDMLWGLLAALIAFLATLHTNTP